MEAESRVYKNKKELIENSVSEKDIVLDVGFWGQGLTFKDENWPHRLLASKAGELYGLDIGFDYSVLENKDRYKKGDAENFHFDVKFDVIFAGDLIEHLSSPGLFLKCCADNLKPEGRIIITTPNCFNLFNLAEKITKYEPTTNKDHVCYFNTRTLKTLVEKNNFELKSIDYIYSLEPNFKESYKKKILNYLYFILSKFTDKFLESIAATVKLK